MASGGGGLAPYKSDSNSLANQLGIHLILARQGKFASSSLANQLVKNRNEGIYGREVDQLYVCMGLIRTKHINPAK
jgi:hypothetical protein